MSGPDAPIERAETPPAAWYHDAAVFAGERGRLFARTWQLLGRESRVREPGEFFTAEIAGEPLVVSARAVAPPAARVHNGPDEQAGRGRARRAGGGCVKRPALSAVLLAAALPACKTAGPEAPRGFADPSALLAPYLDQTRVLRHQGDERTVTVRRGRPLNGDCDVAVYVRSVAFERGSARFSLETIGLPEAGGRRPRCDEPLPGMQLVLSDFPAAPDPGDLAARVEAVLQTPEAYLRAKGVPFELEPGEPPETIASHSTGGDREERELGRKLTAWPEPVLRVQAWYRDPTESVSQQGELEAEVVVGSDGRLHEIDLTTRLAEGQKAAVMRALSLWRFEPARGPDGPVAARIALRPVLQIY